MSHNAEKKTEKGDPLVSNGIVCYAEKRKNLFDSVRWAKWFTLTPENFVEFVELFWSLQVYQKNRRKAMTIVKKSAD